ncbi:MAG: Gfo/Idh/MocA family oxidoreductase [Ignavibacteriales bacterium]|nr:Gfo/Idh/MocA family oxidoreductase [Ignavibacteriales bacterium]
MDRKTKFVIYGSGNIANTYVSAANNIENAEVIGVISRSQKSPSKFPELKSYKNITEIEESFDAVIICTPNYFHHENAIEAAELGKHILCEKPIDIQIKSIDKMIESCRINNVKLGVSYQRRFSSDNPIIKKLIDENKLGKIFSVDLSVKNYRDDAYYNSSEYRGTYKFDGGGPFMQQASHYIDLFIWFFGKPTKLVSKLNTFIHDIEVEDHGAVICSHDNGMISTITCSTATKPGFPAKMEIYTEKGFLILENDTISHWEIDGVENPSQHKNINTHTGSATASVDDTTNHELVIKDFIEAINNNREPLISGEEAKLATEMILEIYQNQY